MTALRPAPIWRPQISSHKDPALNRQVQERIGQQLRAMYNDVVGQGIPERFAELLKQIADAAAEKPKQSGAGG
jgi:Anti-sigma factor NepR